MDTAISPDNAASRPTERLAPPHEGGRRLLRALRERRLPDARRILSELKTPGADGNDALAPAWLLLLEGMLASAERRLDVAIDRLQRAAATALSPTTAATGERAAIETESGVQDLSPADLRLAAMALDQLGTVLRRRDSLDEAHRAHSAAFEFRAECGSAEELWWTMYNLGMDAGLAGRLDEARRWSESAVETAAHAPKPHRRRATALAYLAQLHLEAGDTEAAVLAAESALACWQQHNPAGVHVARAHVALGYALLRHAERLFDADPEAARRVLVSAIDHLDVARGELPAFGEDQAGHLRWCLEQLDFARRLQASLA